MINSANDAVLGLTQFNLSLISGKKNNKKQAKYRPKHKKHTIRHIRSDQGIGIVAGSEEEWRV